jgi:intein-encoded DNA endonuclease-like protein
MTFTYKGSVWRIFGLHKKAGTKWKPVVTGKKGSSHIHASASLLRKNVLTGRMADIDPVDLLASTVPHTKKDVRVKLRKAIQWGYLNLITKN